MKNKKTPYIGITDFTNRAEVEAMLAVMHEAFASKEPRLLMVGVMMNYKTLNGLPSSWTDAWPSMDKLPEIFSMTDGVLNTLHYADYDPEMPSSHVDYVKAIAACGPHIHAIQFDVPWPRVADLQKFKEQYPNVQTILQIGRKSLEQLSEPKGPNQVVLKLEQYGDTIDYVLFDLSGGEGKTLNTEFILDHLHAVHDYFPNLGLAVAGGLGPTEEDMLPLVPIVAEFPDISCDAQGRLRTSRNAKDPITWSLAGQYLRETAKIVP